MANDPNCNTLELLRLITSDPVLVSRILKAVNSTYYALPQKIGSVERAIAFLGLKAVKNLALAGGFQGMFSGPELVPGIRPIDLWQHSLTVGAAARDLGRMARSPYVEEAFTAGILHDIGLLSLCQQLSDPMKQVVQMTKAGVGLFPEVEMRVMGVTHSQVGGGLARQWKFPEFLAEGIASHHDPAKNGQPLGAILFVADTLASESESGFGLTAANQQITPEILQLAGLTEANCDELRQEMPNLLQLISHLM